MRVLIAGCGYVGMAASVRLLAAGHEVHGLRRSLINADELERIGVRPIAGDITDPSSLVRIPGDWDWVVNCVAASGGGPDDYQRVYAGGNRNLIEWLANRVRKYVYTSSTGVYGQDDGSLVDESAPTEPQSATANRLVEAEGIVRQAVADGFPAVILRVAGIYGPGRGYWLRRFLAGEAVMEEQGERILNMVHRDDVAGAIAAALDGGVCGRTYNVTDNEPASQRTVFEWLAARLGRSLPPSATGEVARRRGGATNKRVSNARLRSELKYQFRYPTFREGFAAELEAMS